MDSELWRALYLGVSLFIILLLVIAIVLLVREVRKYRDMFMSQRSDIERSEDEIHNLQTTIALSQIKPHFLYNALNTIYVLCGMDLRMGRQAISDLSDYMRANIGSIGSKEPIPFEKEMEHVRTYISLEQLRFPDEFEVSYVLPVTDFSIPALTIQPLVENAVRHGMMPKGEGGIIIIATRETPEHYIITITDNGDGYDTEDPKASDPEKHVGIRNVRDRLEKMCDGSLEIESTKGYGTEAVIRIPKPSQDDDAA